MPEEVYVIDASAPPSIGRRRNRLGGPTRSTRHYIGVAGFSIASLALHLALLAPFVWGGGLIKARLPDVQGAGASALLANTQPVTALILIPVSAQSDERSMPLPDVASLGELREKQLITLASLDPLPAIDFEKFEEDEEAPSPEAAGDQSGHALLFGRYLGQISARIERAWERPRTPIGAQQFSCQVKIEQNERGDVGEVTLQACNGDALWQLSLVAAIQSASPLPAPPDPSVFANSVSLGFQAELL